MLQFGITSTSVNCGVVLILTFNSESFEAARPVQDKMPGNNGCSV